MSKWSAAALALVLVSGRATAQDKLIKDYGPADFEAFVKDDLKREFKKKGTLYNIQETPFYAAIDTKRKFILFFADVPSANFVNRVTLKDVDTWNNKALYSRAYLIARGAAVKYEGTLSFAAGLTPAQVKSYYDLFDKEYSEFLQHFGGVKAKEGAGASGAAGPPEVLRQGFPAAQADEKDLTKSDTGWEIEWDFAPVEKKRIKLFRIRSARFFWKDAKQQPRSLVVARNIQLAEAFTQYDDGLTCFLDIAAVPATRNLPAHKELLGPACVLPGEILKANNPAFANMVYKEVHYDGLRWMRAYDRHLVDGRAGAEGYEGVHARKGEKLILWTAIRALNYIYLIEYVFTDDGRIHCRLGFTAHNFFDRGKIAGHSVIEKYSPDEKNIRAPRRVVGSPDGDVHSHIGCWRLDFDLRDPERNLGGAAQNEIKLVRRVFKDRKFRIAAVPFPGDARAEQDGQAREGSARWVASEFTTLRAESLQVTNTRGQRVAYDLISTRTGTAANTQPITQARLAKDPDVKFINHDFWVTRTPARHRHYHEVAAVAAEGQPLRGAGATVWHSVAAMHVPRDEDFGPGGADSHRGVALTSWVEFTLRPRNLFDGTPLYPQATRKLP